MINLGIHENCTFGYLVYFEADVFFFFNSSFDPDQSMASLSIFPPNIYCLKLISLATLVNHYFIRSGMSFYELWPFMFEATCYRLDPAFIMFNPYLSNKNSCDALLAGRSQNISVVNVWVILPLGFLDCPTYVSYVCVPQSFRFT